MNNYIRVLATFIGVSAVILAGCSESDFEALQNPAINTVTTNPAVISQKNFSILADDPQPTVINPDTNTFTKTDVTLTIFAGDRNNRTVTDSHTVMFETEYGLINPPSCVTGADGTCTVTWSAITRPEPGGPGSDFLVTVTAYTIGEEAFTDSNGNGIFDDADAGFEDIEEPYVDADDFDADDLASTGGDSFTPGDTIIDVISTNDLTGSNGVHDIADGFFNGTGCTHSSLCAARPSVMIWDDIILKIDGPST